MRLLTWRLSVAREVIRYGTWNCVHCGSTVSGGVRDCPTCGVSRGENIEFSYNPNGEIVTDKSFNQAPDWLCNYCDCLNNASLTFCESCGAPKGQDSKTYLDLKEERLQSLAATGETSDKELQPEVYIVDNSSTLSKNLNEKLQTAEVFRDNYSTSAKIDEDVERYYALHRNYNLTARERRELSMISNYNTRSSIKPLTKIAYFLASILVFFCICFGLASLVKFVTKPKEITITDVVWETKLDVQEYKYHEDSGWSLPNNATLMYTREEQNGTKPVVVGSHIEKVTKTKEVQDGTKEVFSHTEDLGNGAYKDVYIDVPKYKTITYTEDVEVDDIEHQPNMQTKYYYSYWEWETISTLTETGDDRSVEYAEYQTRGTNERVTNQRVWYTITDTDGKKYTINEEDWKRVSEGDTVLIKKFGFITDVLFDGEK